MSASTPSRSNAMRRGTALGPQLLALVLSEMIADAAAVGLHVIDAIEDRNGRAGAIRVRQPRRADAADASTVHGSAERRKRQRGTTRDRALQRKHLRNCEP